MRDTLAALIERVEQATAEQQGEVIWESILFVQNAGCLDEWKWSDATEAFNARAYLSAAASLVPDGCDWHVQSNPSVGACWACVAPTNRLPWGDNMRKAATPALALTAAALRARMESADAR